MSTPVKLQQTASRESGKEAIDAKRDVERAQVTVVSADDEYLEHLGYKQEFKRDFGFLGLFSLVQSELGVFSGVAATIW